MTKTSRRAFLVSTVSASAAAACRNPGIEASQSASGTRSSAFAQVKDIPDNVRRVPGDKYPLPFSDQEYTDRLKKVREKMSQLGIDLLYVTLPEGLCYLHGYEVTWYRAAVAESVVPDDGHCSARRSGSNDLLWRRKRRSIMGKGPAADSRWWRTRRLGESRRRRLAKRRLVEVRNSGWSGILELHPESRCQRSLLSGLC